MSEFFDLMQRAVTAATDGGATWADARVVALRSQQVNSRDRAISGCSESTDRGFGVRVLHKGAWGFAASPTISADEVVRVAKQALRVAEASAMAPRTGGIKWADEPAHKMSFTSPREQDPFNVTFDEKADLLLECNERILAGEEIVRAQGQLLARQVQRWYVNSDGSELHSDVITSTGSITAIAVGNHDFQTRTWDADFVTRGWEVNDRDHWLAQADRISAQAREKLYAADPPEGKLDLVLDAHHLALTIHESVGHATELDRVMGYEVSLAGNSFATTDKKGSFRYGSDHVTLMADNTLEGALASQGFDDDGVPSQRWPIVDQGILKAYSSGREFAHYENESRSRGCCRADHWSSFPIVRIPNLSLMPGAAELTPDELIAGVDHGLYFEGMGSFSIDQRRWNFQFGGDCIWEIRNGKKAGMVKAPIYQSTTPEFWGACDGVADERYWRQTGVINCGKGDPMQIAQMTHGAAPARFRQINVSAGRSG